MTDKRSFRISGTGCALVDYLYNPVDFNAASFSGFLSRVPGDGGLSPGKLVFTGEFEQFTKMGYEDSKQKLSSGRPPVAVNIGGPSIVSLIHVAQLLHEEHVEVFFYGSKGGDEAGRFIEEKLQLTPLKIGNYKTVTKNTPFTDVLSDPEFDQGHGERIFINNIGAAWDFGASDLDDSFFDSDVVVFGGTALVPHLHASLGELLQKAKAKGALTVVNTIYDFLSEREDPQSPWPLGESEETYGYIDLLITDMEEALRLSGATSVESALDFFKSCGAGAVIITHGANPLRFFTRNGLFVHTPETILPVSEKVIAESRGKTTGDTTGCGDNFVGGVLASIALQIIGNPGYPIDLRQAVALGVASGGFACFYNGGTYYEAFPGQKKDLIEAYYLDYLRQIS